LTANTALEEATRTRANELYTQAVEQLRAQGKLERQTLALENLRKEAPRLAELLQEELTQALPEPDPIVSEDYTLADLEQLLTAAEQEHATEQEEVAELTREPEVL